MAAGGALAFFLLAARLTAASAANCTVVGYRYEPFQMPGHVRTVAADWQACQLQCKTTILPTPCAHFAFWPDKGCHLQNSSAVLIKAEEALGGAEVVSGPPACDDPALWPHIPTETASQGAPTSGGADEQTKTAPAGPVLIYLDIEVKNLDASAMPTEELGNLAATNAKLIAAAAGLSPSSVLDLHGKPGVTLTSSDPFGHELVARRLGGTPRVAEKHSSTFIAAELVGLGAAEAEGTFKGNTTFAKSLVASTMGVIGLNSPAIKEDGISLGHMHVLTRSTPVKPPSDAGASEAGALGAMPLWGYFLIVLALGLGFGGLVYCSMFGAGEKKKKKSKKKRGMQTTKAEADAPASPSSTAKMLETVSEPVPMYIPIPGPTPPVLTAAAAAASPTRQMPQLAASVGSPVMGFSLQAAQPRVMIRAATPTVLPQGIANVVTPTAAAPLATMTPTATAEPPPAAVPAMAAPAAAAAEQPLSFVPAAAAASPASPIAPAPPQLQHAKAPPAAPSPLVLAAQSGRYFAAGRGLAELEAAGGNPASQLDSVALERVRRLCALKPKVASMLMEDPSKISVRETNASLKIEWGVKVQGNLLVVSVISNFDDDLVKLLALDIETEFGQHFTEDKVSFEAVGQHHPHEGIWRRICVDKAIGAKNDDIRTISTVDALDDPERAVFMVEVGSTEAEQLRGVPLPAPEHDRQPSFNLMRYQPVRAQDGRVTGVQRFNVQELHLTDTVARIVGVMPGFVLKRMCRAKVEHYVAQQRKMLGSPELARAMRESPRAPMYEQLRQHLLGM